MPGPLFLEGETVELRTVQPDDADALRTISRWAFEERGLRKLTARAYETNPASQCVLEKGGFVDEGVFREEALVDGEYVVVHRYGLLASEFDGQ